MYDEALLDMMREEILAAVKQGHLTGAAGKICCEELGAVKRTMRRLQGSKEQYGIIHADLGFGNILVTEEGLVPIDFSLSGFGCYAQEAGMLQSNYQDDESCQRVLEGFCQGGEPVDTVDADIFLSMSVLLFISAQHNKYHSEQWFRGAMERWCQTLFTHFQDEMKIYCD